MSGIQQHVSSNVSYSTFTNIFYCCGVFLRFVMLFYRFHIFFTYLIQSFDATSFGSAMGMNITVTKGLKSDYQIIR